tara:strand:- start:534 stop:1049 length:516 start_codon:yes stop_codon:yes gene_type:complete
MENISKTNRVKLPLHITEDFYNDVQKHHNHTQQLIDNDINDIYKNSIIGAKLVEGFMILAHNGNIYKCLKYRKKYKEHASEIIDYFSEQLEENKKIGITIVDLDATCKEDDTSYKNEEAGEDGYIRICNNFKKDIDNMDFILDLLYKYHLKNIKQFKKNKKRISKKGEKNK